MRAPAEARRLAAAIVRDLFTNGFGDHAARLVLERPGVPLLGRNLGGWSEGCAVDRVEKILLDSGLCSRPVSLATPDDGTDAGATAPPGARAPR